jgi:hypothetical protein
LAELNSCDSIDVETAALQGINREMKLVGHSGKSMSLPEHLECQFPVTFKDFDEKSKLAREAPLPNLQATETQG